jgi:hypothetical protein
VHLTLEARSILDAQVEAAQEYLRDVDTLGELESGWHQLRPEVRAEMDHRGIGFGHRLTSWRREHVR